MRDAIISCALAALAAVSCSEERTVEAPKSKTRPERAMPVVSVESDVGESADAKPKSSNTISGTAAVTPDADNGGPGQGLVIISFDEDGSVRGTLDLTGARFNLSGEKQEDILRLWAVSKGKDPNDTQRGYLVGQARGEGFEGTFAFSSSGGAPKFKGTWTASNQPPAKP